MKHSRIWEISIWIRTINTFPNTSTPYKLFVVECVEYLINCRMILLQNRLLCYHFEIMKSHYFSKIIRICKDLRMLIAPSVSCDRILTMMFGKDEIVIRDYSVFVVALLRRLCLPSAVCFRISSYFLPP